MKYTMNMWLYFEVVCLLKEIKYQNVTTLIR